MPRLPSAGHPTTAAQTPASPTTGCDSSSSTRSTSRVATPWRRRTSPIFLTTDGNITATELVGDMLVGHVHSTAGDVTLTSPMRILDADGQPSIDVTGDDITMTAGSPGNQGGVGLAGDFLEINVDRNNA